MGRLVFLAHPVRGDINANLRNVALWHKWANRINGIMSTVPWYLDLIVYDDDNEAERAAGIDRNREIISRCDELWLCGGRLSAGMRLEAEHARTKRVIVLDLLYLGYSPPVEPKRPERIWTGGDQ